MARKVEKAAQSSAGDSPALDAVQALTPNIKATIAGRELVFREYTALEGFQVAAMAHEFISDLADCASRKGRQGFKFADVRVLIGKHMPVVQAIAARSADVDEAFVRGLSRPALEEFIAKWFTANAGFFVYEAIAAVRLRAEELSMASHSIESLSDSRTPASETSNSSSSSPSVN